jgi:hypothetical protein
MQTSRAFVGCALLIGVTACAPVSKPNVAVSEGSSTARAVSDEGGPSAPIRALPRIATSSWRLGDGGLLALLQAPLSLSSDGRCLVAGDHDLVVWPAGYSVVMRDGHVTVLDETGADAARVGDLMTAGGGQGVVPANACGLGSAFHIQSRVSTTRR